MNVATTILNQMGGINRIAAMTGAKNFLKTENSIRFEFPNRQRSKPNFINIVLNGLDTYDIEFGRKGLTADPEFSKEDRAAYKAIGIPVPKIHSYKKIDEFSGIYNDQLIEIFESKTGLYLSL